MMQIAGLFEYELIDYKGVLIEVSTLSYNHDIIYKP